MPEKAQRPDPADRLAALRERLASALTLDPGERRKVIETLVDDTLAEVSEIAARPKKRGILASLSFAERLINLLANMRKAEVDDDGDIAAGPVTIRYDWTPEMVAEAAAKLGWTPPAEVVDAVFEENPHD